MASKIPAHAHRMRIVSHWDDMSRLLLMCAVGGCNKTEVTQKGKVKVAERRYRPETDEEYRSRWSTLIHLCCT